MNEAVKVIVVKYADRPHLVLRWNDPITGKPRCKTAGTHRRSEAQRAAVKLEKEIMEGQHGVAARMNWSDFRTYHEDHCLRGLADRTFSSYVCALNVYERFHKPNRIWEITAARVTAWQTHLRAEGKADATIAGYVRHVKAVLRWAHGQGLLAVVPKIANPKCPKGGKLMKGRPITTEEFERMLAAVPSVVGEDAAPSWKHYLRGLWWSGLRLSESLALEWQGKTPGALVVDFSGRRPMLRIPAESQKSKKAQLLPMAPEFAEFLAKTTKSECVGRVFKLAGPRADIHRQADWVSRVVSEIGRRARVVVDQREKRLVVDSRRAKEAKTKPQRAAKVRRRKAQDVDDRIKRKYASAHDLRRAFGLRWSARVMPAVLQQLMRHETIETTMRYYVGRDAEAVADALWSAVEKPNGARKGNKSGNKGLEAPLRRAEKKPQPLAD